MIQLVTMIKRRVKLKKEKKVMTSFLVEADIKERFARVAKANDSTPSQLLRIYIKDYLSKNAQGKLI